MSEGGRTPPTEEPSLFISKMELGPLSPAGTSGPCLPSSFQRDVHVGAKELVPQTVTLVPTCPRESEVPGAAYLRAGPEDRRSLVHSGGRPPLLCSGPRSPASEERLGTGPGSPPSWSHLLASTCPQTSRIAGLPSAEGVSRRDQSVWDGCPLWKRPETLGSVLKEDAATDSAMLEIMAAMLPTCPRKARMPGFPSGCLDRALKTPSMSCLVPTCPPQTAVAGMPFRVKAALSSDSWSTLRTCPLTTPLGDQSLLDESFLFPFSSWRTEVPPGEPHQRPSMVDFVPACPSKSRILGVPCKEFLSDLDGDVGDGGLVQGFSEGSPQGSDQRQVSNMVAMLPSCPVTTCLLGVPSCPQKLSSGLLQVSTRPTEAPRPGPGSQAVPELGFSPVLQRPDRSLFIQPLKGGDMSSGVWGLSSALDVWSTRPSCPARAAVPGCPSALTLTHGPKKVNSSHCPTQESLGPGTVQGQSLLLPQKRSTPPSLEMSSSQMSLRPSCSPGVPSVSCRTLAAIPSVSRLLPTCPRRPGVCGVPSRCPPETGGQDWLLDEKPLWWEASPRPGRLPWQQQTDLREGGLLTAMLSMLASCPQHSHVSGCPSKTKEGPVQVYSMLRSLRTVPGTSHVLGLPALTSVPVNAAATELDVWRTYPSRPQHVPSPGHPESAGDMIQLPCSRASRMVGLPSTTPLTSSCCPGWWTEVPQATPDNPPRLHGDGVDQQVSGLQAPVLGGAACPPETSVQGDQTCPSPTCRTEDEDVHRATRQIEGQRTCPSAGPGLWMSRETQEDAAVGRG